MLIMYSIYSQPPVITRIIDPNTLIDATDSFSEALKIASKVYQKNPNPFLQPIDYITLNIHCLKCGEELRGVNVLINHLFCYRCGNFHSLDYVTKESLKDANNFFN